MKLAELYLVESHSYDLTEEFMIRCWGKLLYIDYLTLPEGRDMSNTQDFIDLAEEFLYATTKNDEDKLEELDEWISEGAPMKDGRKLMNRTTVDEVLKSCEKALDKPLTLYRFDHTSSEWKPDAWVSLTKKESGYGGTRREFTLPAGTKVIDTRGLADEDEFIVNTNVLINR